MTGDLYPQGWKRRVLAALLGMCGTLALPPFFLIPFIIPAFSGLFLLTLHAKSARQAFADGWWWGLGHFTNGLYWICLSLWVEPDKFAWLTPFALFGLPSVLGIYTGLVTLALYKIVARGEERGTNINLAPRPSSLVPLFATLWVAVEFARAHLFTGFPWNLTGYAWNISGVTLQTASVWGIFGQSWLAVLLATLPALLLLPGAKPARALFAGALLLASVIAFGAWRLETHPTEYSNTSLRIVQANIPQSLKFDPDTAMQGLRKHVTLMHSPGLENVDMAVWPETSVPFSFSEKDKRLEQDLANTLSGKTLLLTGGMRTEGEKQDWKAWNSAFVIGNGGIVTHYDKHHLVPFGEYVPLRGILPVEAIAADMGDFSRGPGPATLAADGIPPFSPLICYEAIFPGEATDGSRKAKWLANLTNDAWFGISTGPYQHMEMARTRAVEQGLPLIRAANTGISLVTDSYGRILRRLPLAQEGIIDTKLPLPASEVTIYSRFSAR